MIWISTDETGRINSVTEKQEWASPDAFEFDLPDGFDMGRIFDYVIADGQLTESPKPPTEEEVAVQAEQERRSQMEAAIPMLLCAAAPNMDDEQLLSIRLAIGEWTPGVKRKAGDVVRVGDTVYRVIANVNKNNVAEPGTSEGAGYYKAITVTADGVEEWTMPSDKKNAYSKGDKVSHGGKIYVSTSNNNMDEPGTSSNWEEVTE